MAEPNETLGYLKRYRARVRGQAALAGIDLDAASTSIATLMTPTRAGKDRRATSTDPRRLCPGSPAATEPKPR